MKQKLFHITKYVIICILIIFIVLALYTRFFPNTSGLFGFKVFVVVTGSMEPKLKIGDIVIIKETNYSKIIPGDIIAYQGMTQDTKDKIITHQVEYVMTENNRYIFYTQGLSTHLLDPAVYQEQVYGVMVYKPFILSLISRALTSVIGFILIIVLPLIAMFLLEFKDFKDLLEKKRFQKGEINPDEVQVTQEEKQN